MYTGRTPYSGESKKQSNIQLAETFRAHYLIDENASPSEIEIQKRRIEGLKSINKYPVRYGGDAGLKIFIENLEKVFIIRDHLMQSILLVLRFNRIHQIF